MANQLNISVSEKFSDVPVIFAKWVKDSSMPSASWTVCKAIQHYDEYLRTIRKEYVPKKDEETNKLQLPRIDEDLVVDFGLLVESRMMTYGDAMSIYNNVTRHADNIRNIVIRQPLTR